ncbi:hypothetical protein [Paenibacillus sp. P46E]|uniref:hypothetical protein n=1 Tax=Paenibacillus sp. P46E TaxID=1349436 RepID=UPI00093BCFBC|nr:hypothetical protein [Paenibacillus sp. P46E]OKP97819.1 hypothetical protein A3849_14055 [Paenibacillus sp. P46E]
MRISGGQVSCRHLFLLNILLEYRALALFRSALRQAKRAFPLTVKRMLRSEFTAKYRVALASYN